MKPVEAKVAVMKNAVSFNMARTVAIIATTLTVLTAPISFAMGTKDGGGGTVAVTRNSNRTIKNAVLIDLYEGEKRHKYKILRSNLPIAFALIFNGGRECGGLSLRLSTQNLLHARRHA